jgi:hypothetical protein
VLFLIRERERLLLRVVRNRNVRVRVRVVRLLTESDDDWESYYACG